MLLVPENAGRPNAGSLWASPAGGAMWYENVPFAVPENVKVKLPTCVAPLLTPDCEKGSPFVTYTGPVIDVGVVHVPPGITIQSGLKRPAPDASAARGSYVYQTAKTWFDPACCVKLTPHPDSEA